MSEKIKIMAAHLFGTHCCVPEEQFDQLVAAAERCALYEQAIKDDSEREPGPKILNALGMRREVRYVKD